MLPKLLLFKSIPIFLGVLLEIVLPLSSSAMNRDDDCQEPLLKRFKPIIVFPLTAINSDDDRVSYDNNVSLTIDKLNENFIKNFSAHDDRVLYNNNISSSINNFNESSIEIVTNLTNKTNVISKKFIKDSTPSFLVNSQTTLLPSPVVEPKNLNACFFSFYLPQKTSKSIEGSKIQSKMPLPSRPRVKIKQQAESVQFLASLNLTIQEVSILANCAYGTVNTYRTKQKEGKKRLLSKDIMQMYNYQQNQKYKYEKIAELTDFPWERVKFYLDHMPQDIKLMDNENCIDDVIRTNIKNLSVECKGNFINELKILSQQKTEKKEKNSRRLDNLNE